MPTQLLLRNERPKAGRDASARVGRIVLAFVKWILAGLIVCVMIGGLPSIAEADPASAPAAAPTALPALSITTTPGGTVTVPLAPDTTDVPAGIPLDADTFSVTTPPQVGLVASSNSTVSYTAPADVPEQYVTAPTSLPAQDPTAPTVSPTFIPVFFDYTVCTDLTLTVCQTGIVSVVIVPSTLVPSSDPTVAVESGQTITIAADVYLSRPAGVDWSTLQVQADRGKVTADAESVNYTAAPQVGSDRIGFVACPVGDPSACISGSIAVSVVAPFAPAAAIDSASFNSDGALVVIMPGLRSDNPPDKTTVTVNRQPVAGDVTVSGDAFVVSGLALDFAGPLSFSYYACSSINPADCATGTITVTVPPPAESVPAAPIPGGDSVSGFRPAASVGSPPTAKTAQAAVPQTSPSEALAGSMDITWWVFGGALLLALGGGAGLLTTKKR